jgi:hypothetical protein
VKQHEYASYEEYKNRQIITNAAKLNNVFVQEETLDVIAEKLKTKLKTIDFGICHGTRNGFEQKMLRGALGADVIGTEISPTASQFPDTIEWDFHEVKDEWINSVDFIYSNAIDHSYDPAMCFDKWMQCLRPGGYCILQWTVWHLKSNQDDPFGASLGEMVDLVMPPTPVGGDPNRLNLPKDRFVEEVCRVEHRKMRQQGPDYLIWVKKK